jgi:hypothetical protein
MNAEEILEGPEYFICQKYSARLRKDVCVLRQKTKGLSRYNPYQGCEDCLQGKVIEKIVEARHAAPEKEKKMEGDEKKKCKRPGCDRNAEIRDLCRHDYDLWQKGRLDNEVGPFVCAQRPHRFGKNKRKERVPVNPAIPAAMESVPEKNSPFLMQIDFANHREFLEALISRAEKQIRSVEGQILWELVNVIEAVTACGNSH